MFWMTIALAKLFSNSTCFSSVIISVLTSSMVSACRCKSPIISDFGKFFRAFQNFRSILLNFENFRVWFPLTVSSSAADLRRIWGGKNCSWKSQNPSSSKSQWHPEGSGVQKIPWFIKHWHLTGINSVDPKHLNMFCWEKLLVVNRFKPSSIWHRNFSPKIPFVENFFRQKPKNIS